MAVAIFTPETQHALSLHPFQGPVAIRMAKQAIDAGIEVNIDAGMMIEKACYAQVSQPLISLSDQQENGGRAHTS